MAVLQKLKPRIKYNPAVPLLGIYSKTKKERTQTGSLYTDVHSYIVHNGQKRNRNNPNVYQDVWIDKQNVTFTYSGLFFNLEKEERSESCYSLDEPWMHYTKRIKPGTNGQIVYNSTYIRYIE